MSCTVLGMMTEVTFRDARRIQPWHDVQDETKLAALIEAMTVAGWTGHAVVVIEQEEGDPVAITGSHRIAAARETGTEVQTVNVEDLLRAEGTSLAALDEMYGNFNDDHYEAVIRLGDHLPADVVAFFGLDAH
jgi:uncharacterized ParB-like nuclease family protein